MGKLISRDLLRLERLVDFLQKICLVSLFAENLRYKDMYFNSNSMLVFFYRLRLSYVDVLETELYKECLW